MNNFRTHCLFSIYLFDFDGHSQSVFFNFLQMRHNGGVRLSLDLLDMIENDLIFFGELIYLSEKTRIFNRHTLTPVWGLNVQLGGAVSFRRQMALPFLFLKKQLILNFIDL